MKVETTRNFETDFDWSQDKTSKLTPPLKNVNIFLFYVLYDHDFLLTYFPDSSAQHWRLFYPPQLLWIRPIFLDFFENRRNYAISMVHNIFQGHLEVAEHVFDIIFMFHHVFDSV